MKVLPKFKDIHDSFDSGIRLRYWLDTFFNKDKNFIGIVFSHPYQGSLGSYSL